MRDQGIAGCMDSEACNYNADATCDPNDVCLMLDECGVCMVWHRWMHGYRSLQLQRKRDVRPNDECLMLDEWVRRRRY